MISCTDEYGNKVTGGNLTVYFDNEKDVELATDLAEFWRDNDLIASQPHQIRITRNKKGYNLNLIAREPKEVKQMSFKERKALIELQSMIRESVFKDKKVDLVLCNDQFEPILNINK